MFTASTVFTMSTASTVFTMSTASTVSLSPQHPVNLLSEFTQPISLADLLCELTEEIYSLSQEISGNLLSEFTL